MAELCARMTTNIDAAAPASAVMACQLKAGSPKCGSPRGTVPTTADAVPGQVRGPAHDDRGDHRDQRARDPAG